MRHRSLLAATVALAACVLIPTVATADEPQPTPAPAPAPATAPEATTPAAAVPADKPSETAAAPVPPAPALPDASLQKTIELVRRSPIGKESNAVAYLDLMSAGKGSAAQVNDFAAYIAKRGMPKVALSFQQYALELDPANPTLWQNLGTIQRTTGALGPAATAFKKAIELDPISALSHYNLGAVYDAQGNYDDAIEEYRRALVLDPELADPRKNPQVVNNENLLAVKLEIYRDQAGSLGLPLLQIQKPPAPAKPAKPASDKP
jgi:tetratricopeptide (TPR) repeat protein